ncbi:MAG: hypothetical protein E7564_05735 [Ruminococcaceae bacterium]|nr:hypothetical protein [Oscillospiraceae bacterium]
MSKICFIAHRGYSGRYLMNTEEAFIKAVEHGSGGIETDVRVTKDGVLVLSHDDDLLYEDGTRLNVENSTYEELKSKPLRNPLSDTKLYVCTFERYLEICRDGNVICFIEFKGEFTDEMTKKAFNMAKEIYSLDMCEMQSGSYDNLLRTRKAFPELKIMITAGRDCPWEVLERCVKDGFDLDMDYRGITDEIIELFRKNNLKVALWTANSKEGLDFCVSKNPEFIESDFFSSEKGE